MSPSIVSVTGRPDCEKLAVACCNWTGTASSGNDVSNPMGIVAVSHASSTNDVWLPFQSLPSESSSGTSSFAVLLLGYQHRIGSVCHGIRGHVASGQSRVRPVQRVVHRPGRGVRIQSEAHRHFSPVLVEYRGFNRWVQTSVSQLAQQNLGAHREVLIEQSISLSDPLDVSRIRLTPAAIAPSGGFADNRAEQFVRAVPPSARLLVPESVHPR